MKAQQLLGVAALQLETRPGPTAANIAHVNALLDDECRRLGVRRYDLEGEVEVDGVHLDLLVLPEIFNAAHLMNEAAWANAEGLVDPESSPSLRALATWAARYRCYVVATLLEATPEGHIYNSLLVADPRGGFVTRSSSSSSSMKSGYSTGSSGGGSRVLVRKCRAASLEGFVFRSAGAPGRGGEPEAHVAELDAAPLLAKRGVGGGGGGSSGGGGGGDGEEEVHRQTLRLGFAICYESMLCETMEAIREAHLQDPLDLLVAPFCAMASNPNHPTFAWPEAAAARLAAQSAGAARYHAAKLGVHAVAAHHSGPWETRLPRLLPLLPADPVPLDGPMLGASGIYAPGGTPLAQADPPSEGLLLAQLPLLQHPPPGAVAAAAEAPAPAAAAADGVASTSSLAGSALAAAASAEAMAALAAGPAAPYARYPGGYCMQPAGWQVRWGFPLMEALGSFSYHVWRAPLRRRVARAIAARGVWAGPAPEGGSGCGYVAGAAAAVAAVMALAWARRR